MPTSQQIIRVLLVEDNDTDVLVVREELAESTGVTFLIEQAPRLQVALARLAVQQFDLVLLDLALPDSQGLVNFHKLNEHFPHLPIVLLTHRNDEKLALDAVLAGAQDYLIKGLTGGQLARSIRYAIERKTNQAKLKETEERYLSVVNNLPYVIWRIDRQGRLTFANNAFIAAIGVPFEQIERQTATQFHLPELAKKYMADDEQVMAENKILTFVEENIEAISGHKRYVEVTKTPLHDNQGKVIGLQGIFWDVTDKKLCDDTLRFLAQYTGAKDSIGFFGALAQFLSSSLGADYVRIDRLMDDQVSAEARAVFYHGRLHDNIRYSLKNTICDRLAENKIRLILAGAKQQFPLDKTLQEIDAQGYIGISLSNSIGLPIGLISLISSKPFTSVDLFESILNLVSIRTAGELERDQIESILEDRVSLRTQELKEAKQLAEEASSAKGQFLANMSHEIRTPLNGVIGLAYLALKRVRDPKQRDYLEKIHYSGEHLLKIVNDVLTFSKLESGKFHIVPSDFKFDQIINNFSHVFIPKAAEKKLHLAIEIDPKIHNDLHGDSHRLSQLLNNFVGNAIKFTEKGSVTVRVTVAAESDQKSQLLFEIEDAGIGITPEQEKLLFQSFQQADSKINRQYGGTGLGLAISKQLIELMGGTFGLRSERGVGSTFWFALPFNKQKIQISPPNVRESSAIDAPISLNGIRILIAEDNEFNQQVATEILESVGAKVTIVDNGKKAVDILHIEEFDCVLMDLQMPIMSGVEATQLIRANIRLGELPIIAMTANTHGRDQCLAAGMNDFITKPVEPEILYSGIAKWVSHKLKTMREDTVASLLQIEQREVPGKHSSVKLEAGTNLLPLDGSKGFIDLHILSEMLDGKIEKISKFSLKFIETAKHTLDEMADALLKQDIASLKALGHRSKSSAKAVGAFAFVDLCVELERLEGPTAMLQSQQIVSGLGMLLVGIETEIKRQLTILGRLENQENLPNLLAAIPFETKDVVSLGEIKTLLLDDDPFQLSLVSDLLVNQGVRSIVTETDAKIALEMVMDRKFDLIFCDLSMPGMDGLEFLRLLSLKAFSGDVVLFSGMDESVLKAASSLVKAHGLQFLGALKKPVNPTELAAILLNVGQKKLSKTQYLSSNFISAEELMSGFKKDCLEVFYQPKIYVANRQIAGVECLARWRHPERGIVGPNEFISILEKNGLIDEFTLAVLTKATQQLGIWNRLGHDFKIAVNVSMDNLNRLDLVEVFEDIVRAADVSPKNLVFEMTESRLMDNLTVSLEILTRLRLKGYGLSIDDFGTGFSSMENLKQLPFSELKIDRAFVTGASHDRGMQAILESSTHLAEIFKLNIVAEGVETQEDWDFAADSGCHEVQGYFIAKPMPAHEFIEWKTKWEKSNNLKVKTQL